MGDEESIWDAYFKINGEWKKPIEMTFESDYEFVGIKDDVLYLIKKESE